MFGDVDSSIGSSILRCFRREPFVRFTLGILFFGFNIAGVSSCTQSEVSFQRTQETDYFSQPPSLAMIIDEAERSAQEGNSASDVLATYGHEWFYGRGIGRTIANVGTIALFPPYALYLLGNAGLSLAGYEPLYVTSALPEPAREAALSAYDSITSLPGQLTAEVAGEEFCSGPKKSEQRQDVQAVTQ